MLKSKYLLTFFTAVLIFIGAYAGSKLTLNITSQTTKELSFSINGGVEPYVVTVAGETYKLKEFNDGKVKIKSPLPGKYLILARDSEGSVANFEVIIEK